MERRTLLRGAPVAMLSAAGVARAAQGSAMEQIDGSSALVGVRGVSLGTVMRSDVRSLFDAGVVDCDGYAGLVMNLAGQLKGADDAGGAVGALLLVNVQPGVQKVFDIVKALPAQSVFKSVAELDQYLDYMQRKV